MTAAPPTIADAAVTLTFGAPNIYYGYCARADVEFEFVNKANLTTLTPSAVAQEITYAAIELHQLLDPYYVMPYAGADFSVLHTLRELNAKLAAIRLMNRYFLALDGVSAAAAGYETYVQGRLRDLTQGHERWDPPFGDAVPQPNLPIYARSAQVAGQPSAALGEDGAALFDYPDAGRFRHGSSF